MLNTLYREQLNPYERKAYDELCRGISLHRQDIQISIQPNISKVLSAVNYDHPEFFYVNWMEGNQCVCYLTRMSVHLSMIYDEGETNRINRQIAELARSIPGISNYGKMLGIHDWFVKNVEYDHSGLVQAIRSPGMFSAAGPLIRKKAVCEGVSKLACMLMRQKGIDGAVIIGNADNGTPHAWNAFCADNGITMYADITYDIGRSCSRSAPSREYFNRTKSEISRDRTFLSL